MNKITKQSDDSLNRSPFGDKYVKVKTILKRLTSKIKKVCVWSLGTCALGLHIVKSKLNKRVRQFKGKVSLFMDKLPLVDPKAFSGAIKTFLLFVVLIVICFGERTTIQVQAVQTKQNESVYVISAAIDNVDKDSTVKTTTPIVLESDSAPTEALKSNEEIADEVILGKWGSGQERRNALQESGYDPDIIQSIVDTKLPKPVVTTTNYVTTSGNVLTKSGGVCYNNPYHYKETWYSQKVLPGGGLTIPGRHVDERGLVCDGDGYICVAISVYDKNFSYGSIIQTSLGLGKVYDHGCAVGVIDVYCNW